jgi:protein O-GlcNAc transferase
MAKQAKPIAPKAGAPEQSAVKPALELELKADSLVQPPEQVSPPLAPNITTAPAQQNHPLKPLEDLQSQQRYVDLFYACKALAKQHPHLWPQIESYYSSSAWQALYDIVNSCDWTHYDTISRAVLECVEHKPQFWFVGETTAASPLLNKGHLRAVAERYCMRQFALYQPSFAPRPPQGKIKIAVVGADFHNQATAYLFIGVVEALDKNRFEIHAYDFGPKGTSPLRTRCETAYDSFTDITRMSDKEAAQHLYNKGIDILLHMRGAANGRLGIAAYRPCAVQIQYLYFPGTSGAGFMDYLVADTNVVPPEYEDSYTEKLLHIPLCYQPNDSRRVTVEAKPRSWFGVPDDAIIMANFSQNYKYTPDMFSTWCHLLKQDPRRILWLLDGGEQQKHNLRTQAMIMGIDPERLFFSPPLSSELHLARIRAADLIIDTYPYGGHTLTSDALWAGTPVVTLAGETYASRVAASLLHSIGLPQCIAYTRPQYFDVANHFLHEHTQRQGLRAHIDVQRATSDLFNSAAYARKFEAALMSAVQQRWGGGG